MTAQPSDPPSWYDELDRRITAVEGYQAHVLPHEIAATREAVRLLHTDLRGVSQQVTRQGQRLDQVAAEVSTVARAQIEHGGALASLAGTAEALGGKADALAETQERQGIVQASHGERLEGLAETQASHGQMLASHGQMLAEILRRLPDPGNAGT
jgi:ABC-type transporter Mla subunit MlaD